MVKSWKQALSMVLLCGVAVASAEETKFIETTPLTAPPVKYFGKLHELRLTSIRPEGWLRQWLVNQQHGQTGNMEPAGHPFDEKVWAENHLKNADVGPRAIWACHEQSGYWVDGQMRAGLLLRDDSPNGLLAQARQQTEGAMKLAKADGFMGPLHDDGSQVYYIQWPHVTFFRSFMAAYSGTGDPAVLKALMAHYDREIKNGDINPGVNRHVCNVEELCWLYEQSGQQRYLDEAKRVMDGSKQVKVYSNDEYTAYNAHGVTFMEKAKTPYILYMYTGDPAYLHAGENAVGLMAKYHMLPDGVPSSCAGLFENGPDLSHETCGISDYAWAAGYALLATGETTWADQIERATFNAGPGAVTKDFKAHQYYSAPNQAIATANNYAGLSQYAPVHSPECCSGNVHRFMPNYIARSWMTDGAGAPVATLYGPSRVSVQINGQDVAIEEQTNYPFADKIDFVVRTAAPVEFPFKMRIPGWCDAAKLTVNGEPANVVLDKGTFATLKRTFKDGDIVTLTLPATVKAVKWPGNGAIVERGPLLFAYDIPTTQTIDLKNKHGKDPQYPAYNMEPTSGVNWRLALDADVNDPKSLAGATVTYGQVTDEPFRVGANAVTIDVPVKHMAESDWPLKTEIGKDRTSVMTPWPEKWNLAGVPTETIKLVPYGATCLRIAIFPDARQPGPAAYRHPPVIVPRAAKAAAAATEGN